MSEPTTFEELPAYQQIAMDHNLSQIVFKLESWNQSVTTEAIAKDPHCNFIPEWVDLWLTWRIKQLKQGTFQEKLLSVLERIATALEASQATTEKKKE